MRREKRLYGMGLMSVHDTNAGYGGTCHCARVPLVMKASLMMEHISFLETGTGIEELGKIA